MTFNFISSAISFSEVTGSFTSRWVFGALLGTFSGSKSTYHEIPGVSFSNVPHMTLLIDRHKDSCSHCILWEYKGDKNFFGMAYHSVPPPFLKGGAGIFRKWQEGGGVGKYAVGKGVSKGCCMSNIFNLLKFKL